MTTSFTLSGMIPAVYGRGFRSLRALWPATAIAFAILLAGDATEAVMRKADGVTAVTSWWLLLHAAVIALVAPYKIMLYEAMWGVQSTSSPMLGARRHAILNIVALDLLFFLADAAWLWIWNVRGTLGLPPLIVVAPIVPICWMRMRLSLIDPVLALDALPLSLSDAVSATQGRVWRILLAELLVIAPASPVIVAIVFADHGIQTAFVHSPLIKPILMSPINILFLAIDISVQAELYRRMGLPCAPDADRSPA